MLIVGSYPAYFRGYLSQNRFMTVLIEFSLFIKVKVLYFLRVTSFLIPIANKCFRFVFAMEVTGSFDCEISIHVSYNNYKASQYNDNKNDQL